MATRVAVMYLGRIVEEAETDTLFRCAASIPTAQALLASVLTPEPGLGVPDTQLGAAYPNPLDVPPGCRFHPRCARVMDRVPDGRRRSRLPGRAASSNATSTIGAQCRGGQPHEQQQVQRHARRRHRAGARPTSRAAPFESRAGAPRRRSGPRARSFPPACRSCGAISTRRWRRRSRGWASPRASTTIRLPGQGPVLLATLHGGRRAADRAGLRPRRRHPRPGGPVDQGQGAVGHGARRRPALRPRHRRQQGPAHHQHGGARRR